MNTVRPFVVLAALGAQENSIGTRGSIAIAIRPAHHKRCVDALDSLDLAKLVSAAIGARISSDSNSRFNSHCGIGELRHCSSMSLHHFVLSSCFYFTR